MFDDMCPLPQVETAGTFFESRGIIVWSDEVAQQCEVQFDDGKVERMHLPTGCTVSDYVDVIRSNYTMFSGDELDVVTKDILHPFFDAVKKGEAVSPSSIPSTGMINAAVLVGCTTRDRLTILPGPVPAIAYKLISFRTVEELVPQLIELHKKTDRDVREQSRYEKLCSLYIYFADRAPSWEVNLEELLPLSLKRIHEWGVPERVQAAARLCGRIETFIMRPSSTLEEQCSKVVWVEELAQLAERMPLVDRVAIATPSLLVDGGSMTDLAGYDDRSSHMRDTLEALLKSDTLVWIFNKDFKSAAPPKELLKGVVHALFSKISRRLQVVISYDCKSGATDHGNIAKITQATPGVIKDVMESLERVARQAAVDWNIIKDRITVHVCLPMAFMRSILLQNQEEIASDKFGVLRLLSSILDQSHKEEALKLTKSMIANTIRLLEEIRTNPIYHDYAVNQRVLFHKMAKSQRPCVVTACHPDGRYTLRDIRDDVTYSGVPSAKMKPDIGGCLPPLPHLSALQSWLASISNPFMMAPAVVSQDDPLAIRDLETGEIYTKFDAKYRVEVFPGDIVFTPHLLGSWYVINICDGQAELSSTSNPEHVTHAPFEGLEVYRGDTGGSTLAMSTPVWYTPHNEVWETKMKMGNVIDSLGERIEAATDKCRNITQFTGVLDDVVTDFAFGDDSAVDPLIAFYKEVCFNAFNMLRKRMHQLLIPNSSAGISIDNHFIERLIKDFFDDVIPRILPQSDQRLLFPMAFRHVFCTRKSAVRKPIWDMRKGGMARAVSGQKDVIIQELCRFIVDRTFSKEVAREIREHMSSIRFSLQARYSTSKEDAQYGIDRFRHIQLAVTKELMSAKALETIRKGGLLEKISHHWNTYLHEMQPRVDDPYARVSTLITCLHEMQPRVDDRYARVSTFRMNLEARVGMVYSTSGIIVLDPIEKRRRDIERLCSEISATASSSLLACVKELIHSLGVSIKLIHTYAWKLWMVDGQDSSGLLSGVDSIEEIGILEEVDEMSYAIVLLAGVVAARCENITVSVSPKCSATFSVGGISECVRGIIRDQGTGIFSVSKALSTSADDALKISFPDIEPEGLTDLLGVSPSQ